MMIRDSGLLFWPLCIYGVHAATSQK